jgi:hypothetical protein
MNFRVMFDERIRFTVDAFFWHIKVVG